MGAKSTSTKPFFQNKTFHENIIKDLVNDLTKMWKAEYEQEIVTLRAEIQVIKGSQDFISSKYDSLITAYNDFLETTAKQEEEIKRLKK